MGYKNMTNEEILKKAIEKAVKNGWKKGLEYFNKDKKKISGVINVYAETKHLYEVLYNHDFAKAFWGEKWIYYLREMVKYKEPLKCLEKFL